MPLPVTPLLCVDMIIRLPRHNNHVILIERKNTPYGWALPGGFVDQGESLENAACREALEETSTSIYLDGVLGCYSDPERDPRGLNTASVVYMAWTYDEPKAADDAKNMQVVDPMDYRLPLVFDHPLIMRDYCRYVRSGLLAEVSVKP